MADSISILKGSLKAGVIERPVLQIYKTISDYFERSLKERLNDYDSANPGQLSNDYSDSSLSNQAARHSVSNYNPVEHREYNSAYAKNNESYNDGQSTNNASGSEVQARDTAVQKNTNNTVSPKDETVKIDNKKAENSGELTANNNQKNKSEQVESKAENKADTQQKTKISGDIAVKTKAEAKSLAGELQLVKDGKTNISNLIIGKNSDEITVKNNVKLNENVKDSADANIIKSNITNAKSADANIIKSNNVNVKNELANIKINPGFVTTSAEILQEVKQGDNSIKTNEQGVLQNKDISGLFIKQNEVASKNQSMNEIDNIKPGITNIEQGKIAENLNGKAKNSENTLLPKDDKAQIASAKYVTDNNAQASQNLSKTGIAERVYNTPKIAGKEFDFTNSVGLRRVKLEEIADKTLQLAKNIQSNTTQTARLYLNPPSLGTVYVEISMKENLAKIVMKADTREVMKNLENQLITLTEKLNQQGIKTESIKIEVRQVENDVTDRHAFFEGSNARQKDGKANREFIGTLQQLSNEDELVSSDELNDDGISINTNFL
ncbi:MAG: hypothetical protein A2X61_14060 [Ignavibacteria bacterium GWB2_35_12]|nr:MAG: hypothetical protein A2X61_14060 [Ignavibacteria bacterium GWB2_35_12]OGU86763.1 MAG: hypothetical protein A2220_08815 [Ignavibacteria bacterium RIFOXYA2_FULL_35_10]OGV23154.1 MAG: hypothetical protein A2475_17390 [Ignavibacteria bacterium RIFOXYC2_FULL_35_21]